MIPTREEIDVSNGTLCAMRDEIPAALKPSEDREAKIEAWVEGALAHQSDDGSFPMWKYEIDDAVSLMRSAGDGKALLREIDRLTAELKTARENEVAEGERADRNHDNLMKLRDDLDRANTEAALARDALAKATTPAPEREAAIRAWEEDATLHRCGSRFDDDDPRATYLMARSEITAAVALMRSAGDGKALLRELREDLEVYPDGIWTTREMVAKIGLLLAQPAPSHVYSRGKTIAESAEPPTAYYPPAPVEQPDAAVPDHFPDAGKMVPDDTRELVAQLADVAAEFFVAPWCDRAKAIAAKLRGGA